MIILVILGLVSLIVAAVLSHFGRKSVALKKLMTETPTTWARDVHEGFVEVKGTVDAGETVTTPFHQTQAVFCRWKVEEYRSRGKSSSWVEVLSGVEARDFWVRDDSGRVRVAVVDSTPELYLAGGNTTSSGNFRATPEHIEAFLASHGHSSKGWILNKSMRYTEECIAPGENLYALGQAMRDGREAVLGGPAGSLILANLTEEELSRRIGRNAALQLGGSAIFGLGGLGMIVLGVLAMI